MDKSYKKLKFRAIDNDGKLRYSDEFDSLSQFFLEYEQQNWSDVMRNMQHEDCEGKEIFEEDYVQASQGYKGLVNFDDFIYAKLDRAIDEDIKVTGNKFGK